MTRIRSRSTWALPLLLGLALSACGGGSPATSDPTAPEDTTAEITSEADGTGASDAEDDAAGADVGTEGGGVAASCLEGSVGCDDTPSATGTGGVESGADGSVGVGEAVAAGIQGPFLMSGYLVVDAGGARLCEALAESLPPQCGGASAALEPATAPAGAVTTTEGDVTWSSEPVLVEGELVDGVFVVRTA